MLATLVTIVAEVPFVIVITDCPAVLAIDATDNADPAVAPDHVRASTVPLPVIEVLDVVKACVAPDAILTLVKVIETTRPLPATVPADDPETTVGVRTRPDAAALAVMLPVVAISPV
jgi:hypothetical protein